MKLHTDGLTHFNLKNYYMDQITKYLTFIKDNGKHAPDVYGNADYRALKVEDALKAIEILKDIKVTIVGGDVLVEDASGRLKYAMNVWGVKWHTLNWSVASRLAGESDIDRLNTSYILAKKKILEADEISKSLGNTCYIVFTI